ncbi:MAG: hypothetical protein PHY44_09460 [Lachnospiraceae bacterium]|nr:hypothetical protein [Lachnospiraceae bacterium]
MSTFLSLVSLILGIISWVAPSIAIMRYNSNNSEKYGKLSIISFSSCLASLNLQFLEFNHQVQLQNWSSLMDITGTLKWIAVILSVITILLNTAVYLLYKEKATGR